MQRNDLLRFRLSFEFDLQLRALGRDLVCARNQLRHVSRRLRHHVDQAQLLAAELGQFAFDVRALGHPARREPFPLRVVFGDEGRQDLRIVHLGAQGLQHLPLDPVDVEDMRIRARTGFPMCRTFNAVAAGLVRALGAHSRATRAAQKAGQQVARPAGVRWVRTAVSGLPERCGGEDVRRDDCKVRYFGNDVLGGGVRARDALSVRRIAAHGDLVPDPAAGIEIVTQDAIAARCASVQGRGVPAIAARRPNAVAVERRGDLAWRQAAVVIVEDPANDGSFVLIDRDLAGLTRYRAIAVQTPAGTASGTHHGLEAPARLLRALLALHLRDQAEQADRRGVDCAGVERADFDAAKIQPLVNAREILDVARQAISMLDQHDVEAQGLQLAGGEHAHEAVTAEDRGTGPCGIGIDLDHRETLARGIVAAQGYLVIDRTFVLEVCREAGVDRGAAAHRLLFPPFPSRDLHGPAAALPP
nr:hypothetical protein [Hyphomonas sp.]